MKIYIITTAYRGCVEGVRVGLSLDEAHEIRDAQDKEYNIVRDEDGRFDSADADVQLHEATIDTLKVVSSVELI